MTDDFTAAVDYGLPSLPQRDEPDAHGQAALLLSESILHTLLDAHILTLDQAIGAVQGAAEVKVEVAKDAGESSATMLRSLSLLQAIEQSLATDDPTTAANEA